MYLRVLIHHGRVTSKQFQYLEENVQRKLRIWQSKLLSKSARLLLIQSVCSAIHAYVMNVSKLPGKTVVALKNINWNFFWGDIESHKSTHVIRHSLRSLHGNSLLNPGCYGDKWSKENMEFRNAGRYLTTQGSLLSLGRVFVSVMRYWKR